MITLEKLITENNRLAQKIDSLAIERNQYRVIDGVINPEKYLNAKHRILWILKEANSESLSWSILDNFKNPEWLQKYGRSNPTIRRLIYTTYAILYDSLWNDIPYGNTPEAFKCLEEIAFINIKKEPGDSSAESDQIQRAYNDNQDLLREQINAYDPEIIIFGNTLQYFEKSDFKGLETAERQNTEYGNAYYTAENKLYIWTWHPAIRSASDQDYAMDIAQIVKKWEIDK